MLQVWLMPQSYSISNTKVYSPENYSFLHSLAMTPAELVETLIAKTKKPLTQVAEEMGNRSFQSTLYKFVYLGTKSPRHTTALRIAKYFDLPLEALFDRVTATRIAQERGLVYAPIEEVKSPAVAEEPIPMMSKRPTKHHGLRASTMDRIALLTPKQLSALDAMIESYLDAVLPAKETLAKRA